MRLKSKLHQISQGSSWEYFDHVDSPFGGYTHFMDLTRLYVEVQWEKSVKKKFTPPHFGIGRPPATTAERGGGTAVACQGEQGVFVVILKVS